MKNSQEKQKDQSLSLFDFLGNINQGHKGPNLLSGCKSHEYESASLEPLDKNYSPFMINRGLSLFVDTVMFANAMNERAVLSNKMQYDFLRACIQPKRRFSKWAKKIDDSADVKLIMEAYNYSAPKARDALQLFTKDALSALKIRQDKGGKIK